MKLVVDGHHVKQISEGGYFSLVIFAFHCSQKAALGLFTHDGEPGISGGLTSHDKEDLEKDYYLNRASIAIDKYNQVCKIENALVSFIHAYSTAAESSPQSATRCRHSPPTVRRPGNTIGGSPHTCRR